MNDMMTALFALLDGFSLRGIVTASFTLLAALAFLRRLFSG